MQVQTANLNHSQFALQLWRQNINCNILCNNTLHLFMPTVILVCHPEQHGPNHVEQTLKHRVTFSFLDSVGFKFFKQWNISENPASSQIASRKLINTWSPLPQESLKTYSTSNKILWGSFLSVTYHLTILGQKYTILALCILFQFSYISSSLFTHYHR